MRIRHYLNWMGRCRRQNAFPDGSQNEGLSVLAWILLEVSSFDRRCGVLTGDRRFAFRWVQPIGG